MRRSTGGGRSRRRPLDRRARVIRSRCPRRRASARALPGAGRRRSAPTLSVTGADTASSARARSASSCVRAHGRLLDRHGQLNRTRTREARKRGHEHRRRPIPVERHPGVTRDDQEAQPPAYEPGLADRAVDLRGDEPDLVADRGAVGLDRRCDVRPQQVELEPPEPFEDRHPAAVALRSGDAPRPVEADRELLGGDREALPACDEGDRDRGELCASPLEQGLCGLRGQPAHLDACDTDAAREPRLGAGEGEAEDHRECNHARRDAGEAELAVVHNRDAPGDRRSGHVVRAHGLGMVPPGAPAGL